MVETALRSPSAVSTGPAARLAHMWFAELNSGGTAPYGTDSGTIDLVADGERLSTTDAFPLLDAPPMDDVSAREFLTAQSAALLAILFGDPFRPRQAAAVGQALVRADFVSGGVLGRSLRVLILRLPVLVGGYRAGALSASSLEHRVAELTGALANGYVRALRDRTLAEQESVMRAELDAERIISQRFRHAATHDPLTGLPNRAAVFDRLEAVRSGDPAFPIGLCYLDLDGFKAINDRFGHQTGDELLVAVARRIEGVSRPRGALAGRLGGDEFVVLADGFPSTRLLVALAAGILATVNRPVPLRIGQVSVSACVGIAACAAGSPAAATIVTDADAALYHAKASGHGSWAVFNAGGRYDRTACTERPVRPGRQAS